jgi:hypothetical protein
MFPKYLDAIAFDSVQMINCFRRVPLIERVIAPQTLPLPLAAIDNR